jgi:hypothetical protein
MLGDQSQRFAAAGNATTPEKERRLGTDAEVHRQWSGGLNSSVKHFFERLNAVLLPEVSERHIGHE